MRRHVRLCIPHVFALPYGAGPSWCGHDGACSVGAVVFFRVVFFAGEGGASGACPVVTSGHLLSTSLAREMLSVLGEPSGFLAPGPLPSASRHLGDIGWVTHQRLDLNLGVMCVALSVEQHLYGVVDRVVVVAVDRDDKALRLLKSSLSHIAMIFLAAATTMAASFALCSA